MLEVEGGDLGVDRGSLLVGPCGVGLVGGLLWLVVFGVGLGGCGLVLVGGSRGFSGGCGGGGELINRTQFLESGRCVNMTRCALSPCVSVERSRARSRNLRPPHERSYQRPVVGTRAP
jgi:hypothetical protein